MSWKWTEHITIQLKERKIPKESVESALNNPDKIIVSKKGRIIYQKIIGDKLIRIITEHDNLITVYFTDKIKKYMRGN